MSVTITASQISATEIIQNNYIDLLKENLINTDFASVLSMALIALENSRSDCFSIINEKSKDFASYPAYYDFYLKIVFEEACEKNEFNILKQVLENGVLKECDMSKGFINASFHTDIISFLTSSYSFSELNYYKVLTEILTKKNNNPYMLNQKNINVLKNISIIMEQIDFKIEDFYSYLKKYYRLNEINFNIKDKAYFSLENFLQVYDKKSYFFTKFMEFKHLLNNHDEKKYYNTLYKKSIISNKLSEF
jgi:hypothetical protein